MPRKPTISEAETAAERAAQWKARNVLRDEVESLIMSWCVPKNGNAHMFEEGGDQDDDIFEGDYERTYGESDDEEEHDWQDYEEDTFDGAFPDEEENEHPYWAETAHPPPDEVDEEEEPPFSVGELVIIALICSNFLYMDKKSICDWIIETFPYYAVRSRAKAELSLPPDYLEGDYGQRFTFIGFDNVFFDAEIPLSMKKLVDDDEAESENESEDGGEGEGEGEGEDEDEEEGEEEDEEEGEEEDEGEDGEHIDEIEDAYAEDDEETCWSTKPCQARMYLRRWLEPKRKGVFRFLDLPAELRNRVYEELLIYPGCGLEIDPRSLRHAVSKRICNGGDRTTIRHLFQFESPTQTLQILRTCKQIYQEAMPVYYGLNKFFFSRQQDLCHVLGKLSPDRARHVKNIHVALCRFCPPSISSLPTVIGSMLLDNFETSTRYCCFKGGDQELEEAFIKPDDYANVSGINNVVALAQKSKQIDASPKEAFAVDRTFGKLFPQFIRDQLQQAGSTTKVITTAEWDEQLEYE